jgi:hypothetical protein
MFGDGGPEFSDIDDLVINNDDRFTPTVAAAASARARARRVRMYARSQSSLMFV